MAPETSTSAAVSPQAREQAERVVADALPWPGRVAEDPTAHHPAEQARAVVDALIAHGWEPRPVGMTREQLQDALERRGSEQRPASAGQSPGTQGPVVSATQAAVYEVREVSDAQVFPLGTGALSTHQSVADTQAAIEREAADFRTGIYAETGAHLYRRIIVRVDPDGAEHRETGVEENGER